MSQSSSTTALGLLSLACFVATCVALFLAQQHARRARDGDEALAGAGTLREGGTVVVGVVETDGEAAITLRLDEHGREWRTKHGWRHAWREVARELSSRPFVVVTDEGERVRVDPPSDVFLVDALRVTKQNDRFERVRSAELVAGERVAATGRLRRLRAGKGESAYRTAPTEADATWSLDAPARGRMVVSTEPMADRDRDWASFHRKLALVPVALLVAMNALAYRPFYDFALHGHGATGTLTLRQRYEEWSPRYGVQHHYRAYLDLDGEGAWIPLDSDGYYFTHDGDTVPVVLTPEGHVSLGPEPGIPISMAVVDTLVGSLVLLVSVAVARSRRLWWEQRRVVTTGPGPIGT